METVRYEVEGSGARVTIARAEKRNALNVTVMRELHEAFVRARDDEAVHVVVLTGDGDKAFSAGGDLGGFTADQSKVQQHLLRGQFAETLDLIRRLGKPVVARVNGHALAGGFGLMCACDIVVAVDEASFGMPEIDMGLWPFIITAPVAWRLGGPVALELMMTGRRIDAAEAERIGAVNHITTRDALDKTVEDLVATLASKSPIVMRLGKDAFYRSLDMGYRESLDYLHSMLGICLDTEDVVEGVTAFFEKRPPKWKGR